MRASAGHSLVEVLVAGLVLTAGLLPASAAVASGIRLATRGRARAAAALAVMARLDQLRAEADRTTPRCQALASGSLTTTLGAEQWQVAGTGDRRDIRVVVTVALPSGPVADTGEVRFRCG